MKKIQLTDGLPTSIGPKEQSGAVNELTNEIHKVCEESGLSYVEVNKALYLADKGLYLKIIAKRQNLQ